MHPDAFLLEQLGSLLHGGYCSQPGLWPQGRFHESDRHVLGIGGLNWDAIPKGKNIYEQLEVFDTSGKKPKVSKVGATGFCPSKEMAPYVGFIAKTPVNEAGRITLPQVCDPRLNGT